MPEAGNSNRRFLSHFCLEKRLISRDGRLALIENVVEGFGARTAAQASRLRGRRLEEPGVKTEGSGGEHFEELFLAHYSRVVTVLQRVVGDFGRAEELASEVFLKLYRKPLSEWPEGNVPGWLYRTATNLGIDELRATARRSRLEQSAAANEGPRQLAENGLDRMLRSERQQRVRGILADLQPAQAQMLLLRAAGHSYKELAAALDVGPGSVGTLLVRAEAAFEKSYRELYGNEEDL